MRVIQISDSQLGTWYDCNLKHHYEKTRRLRLIGASPYYMQEGSVIHKMLETFYRLGIPIDGQPPTSYSDRAEKAMDEGVKYATMTDWIDINGERLQFLKDSMFQYADYWRQDGWIPRGVEQRFTMELYRQEDSEQGEGILVLYEGITDLVVEIPGKEGLIPVDHKSSSSFKKLRHPSLLSGQFIGYAIATDSHEVVENKFGLQTSYEPKDRFIRHPISYDEHVLEEWKAWTVVQAIKMDRSAQANYFEPNYNACKRGCVFTTICFTRPSVREWKITKDFIIGTPSGKGGYKNDTE